MSQQQPSAVVLTTVSDITLTPSGRFVRVRFTPVRVPGAFTDETGNPWFVAKDVCFILELGNLTEAIRNLDDDEKADLRITEVSSNGRVNPEKDHPAIVLIR